MCRVCCVCSFTASLAKFTHDTRADNSDVPIGWQRSIRARPAKPTAHHRLPCDICSSADAPVVRMYAICPLVYHPDK